MVTVELLPLSIPRLLTNRTRSAKVIPGYAVAEHKRQVFTG